MLRVLFDEVLHIGPSDAFWTVAGRSKSVIQIIKLDVVFPLDGVVLVFGCGSAAKIERVVFWGTSPSIMYGTVLTCVGKSHLWRRRVSDGIG